jgi:outer membrane receptor protein involved in Fe transport
LGVSVDWFEDFTIKRDQWNPKLGLVWSPNASTQVRAAGFRTMKRALIADQTIEPTQVAGFNQFFDDANGTDATRIGLGIDQRVTQKLFAGLELSERRLDWPRRIGNTTLEEDQRERLYRAYLSFMPTPRVALSAQVLLDELDLDPVDLTDLTRPVGVKTLRAPLEAKFFPNERWSWFVKLEGIRQEVEALSTSGSQSRTSNDEDFWLLDVGVSLRLPQRRGTIALQVNNLLDEEFVYQDTNFRSVVPRLPEFLPGTTVFVRLNLVFQ